MAFVLRLYGKALETRPLLTHSVTAGILYGGGDVMAQTLEKAYNVQSKGKDHYNSERTARMFIFGFVAAGPILGTWYPLLHRMTSVFRYEYVEMKSSSSWLATMQGMYRRAPLDERGQRQREVLLKVALDQLLFQAPFLNFYLLFISLLEGHSLVEAYEQCKRNFHDAWRYSITFWCPAQWFNFSIVPSQYNALTVNFFSMIWTAFLSLLYHYRDYGHDDHKVSVSGHDFDRASVSSGDGRSPFVDGFGSISNSTDDALHKTSVATTVADLCGSAASWVTSKSVAFTRVDASSTHSPPLPSSDEKAAEVHALKEIIEVQSQRLQGQELELDALRRTVAAQAVRIQLLLEGGRAPGNAVESSSNAIDH